MLFSTFIFLFIKKLTCFLKVKNVTLKLIKSKGDLQNDVMKSNKSETEPSRSSVYSQQIMYCHLGRQLRITICGGTTGHDQRVIKRPEGRMGCRGRPISLLLPCNDTVCERDFHRAAIVLL